MKQSRLVATGGMSKVTNFRRCSKAARNPPTRPAGMQKSHPYRILQSVGQMRKEWTNQFWTRLGAKSRGTSKFECSFKQFQSDLR